MEDFEVDDFFAIKNKKKKLDSGRKGKRKERELAKILNERFGEGFSRSVGSGNRYSQVKNLPKHAQDTFSSDLTCPEFFNFTVECKGGYNDIDLNSAFEEGHKELDSFLKQVEDESKRCGRKPLLVWKKDRKPWLTFFKTDHLPHLSWNYRMIYRDWSVISLKEFLLLEREFFFSR